MRNTVNIGKATSLSTDAALVDAAPFGFKDAKAIGGLAGLSIAFATSVSLVSALAGVGFFQMLMIGSASLAAAISVSILGFAARKIAKTLQHQGQSKAHVSDHMLQTLARTTDNMILRFARDGEIAFSSDDAVERLNCQRFEVSAKGIVERVHLLDRPNYMAVLSDARFRGEHATIEARIRRDSLKPGAGSDYIWHELVFAPVAGTKVQDTTEVLAMFRDITQRKQDEMELQNARVDAEKASDSKSKFLASISHELRTPLNAIVGFSELMQEGISGELNASQKEYIGLIYQSGHHLLSVVNMLLDMSKIEAGKFDLFCENFNPTTLVQPCLRLVEKQAFMKSVKIVTQISDTLPNIKGDERACRQILINLISNAVKFSHDGGEVHVGMKRQGKMLALTVRDFGIGMDANTVKRIGEPFMQQQEELSRRYEGTGLGLSIVKGMVSLHEGRLTVHSQENAGTSITVLLPIDGPASVVAEQKITNLTQKKATTSDEVKWLEDEKRSAAR